MQVELGPIVQVPETHRRDAGMTAADAAERLSEGGALDRSRVQAQFRGLVRRGYVHPVAVYCGDKRGAYLYDLPAVFTGAVLGRLCDAGLKDGDAMAHAALALNVFSQDDFPDGAPYLRVDPATRAWSPAAWLLDAIRTGLRGWALDIGTFRNPRFDNAIPRARLRNGRLKTADGYPFGTNFRPGGGYALRSVVSVNLDDVATKLLGVHRAPGETLN